MKFTNTTFLTTKGIRSSRTILPLFPIWVLYDPVFDYDFKNDRYYGPPLTNTRASTAYMVGSDGNYQVSPVNGIRREFAPKVPRTNYVRNNTFAGTVLGRSQNAIRNNTMIGAIVGSSQNAIRNNTMQGALVGIPGTVPTYWLVGAATAGLSSSVVRTGSDNGVDYIDFRIYGRATASTNFDIKADTGSAVGAQAQTWTYSTYLKLVTGSTQTLSIQPFIGELTSATIYSGGGGTPATLTNSLTRFSTTRTLTNSLTTQTYAALSVQNVVSGTDYDFTIRIGNPQFEQSAFVGPVAKTTGTVTAYSAGTAPTNWLITPATGITTTVVSIGQENGIDYIDVRFNGTATGTSAINFEAVTGISATNGQTWTESLYCKLIAGSYTNLTTQVRITNRNSGGGASTDMGAVLFTASSGSLINQRFSGTGTINDANAVYTQPRLYVNSTGVIDITVRIGNPQLEQSATAGPVTRTTGAALSFSKGSVPSTMSYSEATGVPGMVVGTGMENGIDYVDIRWFGTATAAGNLNFTFEKVPSVGNAYLGQTWTYSYYRKLVAGSLANLGALDIFVNEYNSATTYLQGTSFIQSNPPTSASLDSQRFTATRVIANSAVYDTNFYHRYVVASGAVVDVTLRFGLPQMEINSVATAPIETYGFVGTMDAPRTNLIRNNTMQGVVVGQSQNAVRNSETLGANGATNTGPTNWATATPGGLTRTITVQTRNGIDGILFTYKGTTVSQNNISVSAELFTNIAAVSGQTWSSSLYYQNDKPGLTWGIDILERASDGGAVTGSNVQGVNDLSFQRISATRTFNNANTAFVNTRLISNVINTGTLVDAAFWVGGFQIEQAYTAGPYTKTTGTAAAFNAGVGPTNWLNINGSSGGITRSVVGKGTVNNFDYIDIRFSGSTNTNVSNLIGNIGFEQSTTIPAAIGQTFAQSSYFALISGTLPNTINLALQELASGLVSNGFRNTTFTLTNTLTRFNNIQTLTSATTITLFPSVWIYGSTVIGTVVDFTLRIASPQIEQNGIVTDVIKTYGYTVTTDTERKNFVRNNTMQGAVLGQSQNAIRNNTMQGAVLGQSQNLVRNSISQGAVAGQYQNAIRNSSMQGTVAGSPGTLPTNWTTSAVTGITRTINSFGTDNGLDYIELYYTGTATQTGSINIDFEPQNIVPASVGQTWTVSSYLRLVSGTFPSSNIQVIERGGSATPNGNVFMFPTNYPLNTQRFSATRTFTTTDTVNAQPRIAMSFIANTFYDFTIRIAAPQLEQSTSPNPVVRTTGTAIAYSLGAVAFPWGATTNPFVVGTGQEDGINYIDLRFTGTTATQTFRITPETITQAAGANIYTSSVYLRLIAGSLAPVGGKLIHRLVDVGGATNASGGILVTPTNAPLSTQRSSVTKLTASDATSVRIDYIGATAPTDVYDFTLRVGLPQLEQSASAGPVTKTSGTAAAYSAGTLPTNWTTSAGNVGLNLNVVGTGTENGIDYIDLRILGTATATGSIDIRADSGLTSATVGQTWTFSSYVKSITNTPAFSWSSYIAETNSAGGVITGSGTVFSFNSTLTRVGYTRTLTGTNTANIYAVYSLFQAGLGITYDFTIRIGNPQLEQAATAGPVTRTTGTAANFIAGSIPNWAIGAPSGMTCSVVATGIEKSIPYADLRFSGVPTVSNVRLNLEANSTASASIGQTWTHSGYYKLAAGSLTNTNIQIEQREFLSGSPTGGLAGLVISPTTADLDKQRFTYTRTLTDATANSVQPTLRVATNTLGAVYDFTLRIGLPQLEQNGIATDPIQTTGSVGIAGPGNVGCRGLLSEIATTNFVRNNSMQGAVLTQLGNAIRNNTMQAASLTGPVLPTYWSTSSVLNGISIALVGVGTENGVEYTDYRFSGTATTTSNFAHVVELETNVGVPAVANQVWLLSAYLKVVSGTLPATVTPTLAVNWFQSDGSTSISVATSTISIGSTLTRTPAGTLTAPTATAYARPRFRPSFNVTANDAIDFTIRIGNPQFEQAPVMTPVVKTTGTAVPTAPGSFPAFWFGENSPTQIITGLGTEDGIDYIDLRFTGTATQSYAINFESTTTIPASAGQVWTSSFFTKLIAGSLTNIPAMQASNSTNNSIDTNPFIPNSSSASLIAQRVSITSILTGTPGSIRPRLRFTTTGIYDFTVRIGWPQIEVWSSSVAPNGLFTSPVRTTNASGTRNADSVSGTLPYPIYDWTAAFTGTLSAQTIPLSCALSLSGAFSNDRFEFRTNQGFQNMIGISFKNGSQSSIFPSYALPTPGTRMSASYAQTTASGEGAISVNGLGPNTAVNSFTPNVPLLNFMIGGNLANGASRWGAPIERVILYGRRRVNSEVSMTALLATWGG